MWFHAEQHYCWTGTLGQREQPSAEEGCILLIFKMWLKILWKPSLVQCGGTEMRELSPKLKCHLKQVKTEWDFALLAFYKCIVPVHTLEKLDSGSSSPSGSSHPYLLSSKEQIVWGCLVVSASSLSPVVSHCSSPGLEKGRICLYCSDAGTDWSPCSQRSMICPWIFICHLAAPAQRPETSAPAEHKSCLCSWSWALAAHFCSRTLGLALCFFSSSPDTPVRWLDFYSQLILKWSKPL